MSAMGLVTTLSSAIQAANLSLDFVNQKYSVNGVSKTFSDLITFTRSSTGTYTDKDGLIKTAAVNTPRFDYDGATLAPKGLLIEELRTNQHVYSENLFSWANSGSGSTPLQITPLAADGPRGPNTMTRVAKLDTGARYIGRQVGAAISGTATFSFYAKAGTANFVAVRFQATYPARVDACFNLATGTISSAAVAGGDVTAPSASITPVGNGVYRCTVTGTAGATPFLVGYVSPQTSTSTIDVSTGAGDIYLDAFQAEAGAFATSYIPTPTTFTSRSSTATYFDQNGVMQTAAANVARDNAWVLDNGTMRKIGLLSESAATNVLTRSSDFSNAAWTKVNSFIQPNVTAAPDGMLDGSAMVGINGAAQLCRVTQNITSVTSGTAYTLSVYAKMREVRYVRLLMTGVLASTSEGYFDLQTGVSGNFAAGTTGQIIPVGNGWYRLSITATATQTGAAVVYLQGVSAMGTPSMTGDGVSGLYFWGAMFETGQAPTSYVPSVDTFTSRAGSATYLDQNGVMQTAGTNVARSNTYGYDAAGTLLPVGAVYEATATNLYAANTTVGATGWTTGASGVVVRQNAEVAPDGTLTANYVTNTPSVNSFISQSGVTLVDGTTYCRSIYVKPDGSGNSTIAFEGGGTNSSVSFNAVTKTWSNTSGVISYGQREAGNGWMQVWYVATRSGTGGMATAIYLGTYGNVAQKHGAYLWGAQLETGTQPTSLIITPSTFTSRASIATYFNSTGTLATAGSGVARSSAYGYDSTGTLKPIGLLTEAASATMLASSQFGIQVWQNTGCRRVNNVAVAPDGTCTGVAVIEDTATIDHRISIGNISITNGTTYTASIWAKANTRRYVYMIFSSVASWGTQAQDFAKFDLQTGALITAGSAMIDARAYPGPNGWYRLSITAKAIADSTVSGFSIGMSDDNTTTAALDSYTGNGVSSIYVWGPQMESAASVASSYMPSTDTFTSRTGVATYVDSTGAVKTAAAGVARSSAYGFDNTGALQPVGLLLENFAATNLLTYPCAFEDTVWARNNTAINPDCTVAPNGMLNGDKMVENSINGTHRVLQSISMTSGTAYTFSVYLKAGGRDYAQIRYENAASTASASANVSLIDGSVSVVGSVAASVAGAMPAGNGWWRVFLTFVPTVTEVGKVVIYSCNTSGNVSYTGDGRSAVYMWGAQLEAQTTPSSFVPDGINTGNRASTGWYFDSTGTLLTAASSVVRSAAYNWDETGTLRPMGNLLERAATNKILNSSNPNISSGTCWTVTSVTKAITGPTWNGMTPCTVASTGANWHRLTSWQGTPGATEALTFFYKAGTSGRIRIVCRDNVLATESTVTGPVGGPYTIVNSAGQLYLLGDIPIGDTGIRMIQVAFAPLTPANQHAMAIGPDSNTSGQTIIVYAGQQESNSYPTSYIPTDASTVTRATDGWVSSVGTRNAEVVSTTAGSRAADSSTSTSGTRAGDVSSSVAGTRSADVTSSPAVTRQQDIAEILTLGAWYNTTEGTLMADTICNGVNSGAFPGMAGFVGNTGESIGLYYNQPTGRIQGEVKAGNVAQGSFTGTNYTLGIIQKAMMAWKLNDFALSINGTPVATDTSGTIPVVTTLRLGQYNSTKLNGTVRSLTYHNVRQPNALLEILSK